ncbi:HTH domain-containing protein [Candidatus Woesearchaeota archaeon]|nr:HTH domain-containing protein [Candidatus Woesearchaeota archaeon]
MFEKRDLLSDMDKKLKTAFKSIKEEFEDHLESINDNTNEIQSNYEYICKFDSRLDKVEEKLEEFALFLKQLSKENKEISKKIEFKITPLTEKEKEVFLALYILEEATPVSYKALAQKLAISEALVQNYTGNLIEKGIPIIKKYINNETFLKLNLDFRQLQTKENIVGINAEISKITVKNMDKNQVENI